MYCSNCGAGLHVHDQICPRCGYRITSAQDQSAMPQNLPPLYVPPQYLPHNVPPIYVPPQYLPHNVPPQYAQQQSPPTQLFVKPPDPRMRGRAFGCAVVAAILLVVSFLFLFSSNGIILWCLGVVASLVLSIVALRAATASRGTAEYVFSMITAVISGLCVTTILVFIAVYLFILFIFFLVYV